MGYANSASIFLLIFYLFLLGVSIYALVLFIMLAKKGIKALDIYIKEKTNSNQ